MGELLPFGQYVRVTHQWHQGNCLWITNARKSPYNGTWEYGCRSDERQNPAGGKGWQWGEVWFTEMDLEPLADRPMGSYLQHSITQPERWPPVAKIGRRPGLWVTNGHPGDPIQQLSWRPGALTCFFDYLEANGVFGYKAANPEVPIIIRFQHPTNWHADPSFYAKQLGEMVASKWSELKVLDPYVYFANEMNLYYENGDKNAGNQHLYTTPEFYAKYAHWVELTADVIKNIVPEMKLVTPPFASGHHEDGAPDDDGNPKEGWAGFDYLTGYAEGSRDVIGTYFNDILTGHYYWPGDAGGSDINRLYDEELSSWYAFRWKRVLKLFETRYGKKAKMIIDEAGNFATSDVNFTDQIMYHARECLGDPGVICVTYFLWLDPTNSPGNLPNSWVQGCLNLSEHIRRLREMPDVKITGEPEPQPGPGPIPPEPQPPTPEPEPTGVQMKIEYVKGHPVIKGAWIGNGDEIVYTDPWGNQLRGKTGFKVEPGLEIGGFSFPAYGGQTHSLDIESYYYEVFVKPDHAAILSFTEGAPPEPGPEPPEPEPEVLYRLVSKAMTKEEAEVIAGQHPDIFEIEEY